MAFWRATIYFTDIFRGFLFLGLWCLKPSLPEFCHHSSPTPSLRTILHPFYKLRYCRLNLESICCFTCIEIEKKFLAAQLPILPPFYCFCWPLLLWMCWRALIMSLRISEPLVWLVRELYFWQEYKYLAQSLYFMPLKFCLRFWWFEWDSLENERLIPFQLRSWRKTQLTVAALSSTAFLKVFWVPYICD